MTVIQAWISLSRSYCPASQSERLCGLASGLKARGFGVVQMPTEGWAGLVLDSANMNASNMFWISAIATVTMFFTGNARADLQGQPNILLIMADDLGYDSVESYGSTSYETPNMTRLASEGIQFDHAYATPLCTNTRIQLMTGKYNNRNWKAFGIFDPKDKTLGHYLQMAGYKTAIAGKWQLQSYDPIGWPGAGLRRGIGMKAEDAGFDAYSLWHTGHTEDKGSRYADPVINQNGKFLDNTEGKYGPDLWVDFICRFMEEQRDSDQPFFVYYSMALPHNPFSPTPASPEWREAGRRFEEAPRYYKDMVEYTDALLGRLIDRVDALGIREQTLIIFYSDNGTNPKIVSKVGDRFVHGGKGTPSDLGTRVPLVASWKGTSPESAICDDLVDSTDVLPTILDAAGSSDLAVREMMDGRSFLPQIKGEQGTPRDWIYVHQDARPGWDKDKFTLVRFARGKRYKLYEDGRLYNVPEDLYEESPIMPDGDNDVTAAVREVLQPVLDVMKPYPIYDPQEMPRPNLHQELFANHSFEDWSGYVVMEAESVPVPRDESWIFESAIPGFTGTGYLRALRDQPDDREKGVLSFDINLATGGDWTFDVRHRHDHADADLQNGFWMKIDDGSWRAYESKQTEGRIGWEWGFGNAEQDGKTQMTVPLEPGVHRISIAPRHDNFKIDRIVAYRSHRESRAMNLATPQSRYHPWVNKYLK